MPNFNGLGPNNEGKLTGRGRGIRYNSGFQYSEETLAEYKRFLEEELEMINNQKVEEKLD